MATRGKRYAQAQALLEEGREYEPEEAVALVKQTATAAFDETVELHLRTGADPRHADQQIRGIAVLPHGVGKLVRVLVFAQGETASAALEAGADFAGNDDIIAEIQGGWVDFDVSIATPDMMSKVGRLGRILGRRGLMPNPRTGTVVPAEDVPRAIDEAKKGRVEYRLDRTALMHLPIGRASFEESMLVENMATLVSSIVRARPGGVKGQLIRSAFLTSTMGPSVKLNVASTSALKVE
jgi:large subunit ribosomal protein L1